MSAATVAFVDALVDHAPELRPLLQEHLHDQEGEMLPHLFMADVERWVEAEVVNRQAQSRELVQGVLDFLENQLGTGNEDIANVIHASFLEHLPRPGEPGSELRSMVGPLMAERLQQIG